MKRCLVMSVRFYDHRYHGQFGDGEVEWPPAPFRLFQALLAGTGSFGGPTTEEKHALRWLEKQPPPLIRAPVPEGTGKLLLFVPANQADVAVNRQDRLTGKLARYAFFAPDSCPEVHYIWPLGEAQAPSSLFSLAQRLLALGWGVDQASAHAQLMNEEALQKLSGILWRPVGQGGLGPSYRVPTVGSLEDLLAAYETFRDRLPAPRHYRPPRPPRVFATCVYLPDTALPHRPFAVFRLPEGLAFRQENTAKVAAMVRGLAIKAAQQDGLPDAETFVAGHVQGAVETPPRFSYAPLPSIGHPHADGLLRRIVVAEPLGGDGSRAQWAQWALHNAVLTDEEGNQLGRLRVLEALDGVVRCYWGPSRSWSSVTPVILPGFDDRKPTKALKLLREALGHAGIPEKAVVDARLQKAPFWPSSSHPSRYFCPEYLRGLPRWHVQLVFSEPVLGPILVGAGRHVGLGLFAVS
ncbi:MAG: type I-U CRISPR-associated protein Csb2 [Thermoanaerobaculum sp.]